jgi:hypothetical protein
VIVVAVGDGRVVGIVAVVVVAAVVPVVRVQGSDAERSEQLVSDDLESIFMSQFRP